MKRYLTQEQEQVLSGLSESIGVSIDTVLTNWHNDHLWRYIDNPRSKKMKTLLMVVYPEKIEGTKHYYLVLQNTEIEKVGSSAILYRTHEKIHSRMIEVLPRFRKWKLARFIEAVQ